MLVSIHQRVRAMRKLPGLTVQQFAEAPLISEVGADNYLVIDHFGPRERHTTVPVSVEIKRHTFVAMDR